jgi:serine/threonine-protein kinase
VTLPDRYRVVRHLANGGMASVWEAHDELLDRPVAVKVLATHLSEDDRARRRFAREARAAAGLSSHPHVVTIYDVAELDGASFIVMELLRGGTVADELRSGDAVPHRVALRWLAEAGSALDAAHEAGIVHRDVKPANMLLDEHGRLALADFGIARLGLEDQITQTGQVLGTAAYLAPEQAMGEASTAATDRYALAVVAFELLTGGKPFQAENFAAQARAHVDDEPPLASERDLDVPPAGDRVLVRGMAKDPDERWESAGAMVRALDDALSAPPPKRRAAAGADATRVQADGTPPAPLPPRRRRGAAEPPPLPPGRRRIVAEPAPPRRNRSVGLVLALAALLLVGAGAVALAGLGGDDDPDGGRAQQPTATATAEATPERTATAEPTDTPTPEPTDTPTPEPTATPSPEPTATPDGGGTVQVRGTDPTALQLRAYELNQAGDHERALAFAQKAVELCAGSTAVSPCAYALYELARARRLTGDPQGAIAALEERKRRFPGNQPGAVEKELALARQAAGGGGD